MLNKNFLPLYRLKFYVDVILSQWYLCYGSFVRTIALTKYIKFNKKVYQFSERTQNETETPIPFSSKYRPSINLISGLKSESIRIDLTSDVIYEGGDYIVTQNYQLFPCFKIYYPYL